MAAIALWRVQSLQQEIRWSLVRDAESSAAGKSFRHQLGVGFDLVESASPSQVGPSNIVLKRKTETSMDSLRTQQSPLPRKLAVIEKGLRRKLTEVRQTVHLNLWHAAGINAGHRECLLEPSKPRQL